MSKVTIILIRLHVARMVGGFHYGYKVVRVKNALSPIAGALMTDKDVQALIEEGKEVIIDPEGSKPTRSHRREE